jgi:hypothetical protein
MSGGLGRRLACVAVAVVLSACSSAPASPAPAGPTAAPVRPPPQLQPEQARSIAVEAWQVAQVWAQVPATATVIRQLDDGPARAAGVATVPIRGQLGQRQDRAAPLSGVTVYVPRLDAYPLWFAALFDTTSVDAATDRVGSDAARYLDVFVRDGPGERWRLYMDANVTGVELPQPALDPAGYVAGDPGQLAARLDDLPGYYVDYLRSAGRTNAKLFAPGDLTSQAAWDVAHTSGTAYSFATDRYLRFQIPLRQGGAIGIFSVSRRFALTASPSGCLAQDRRRTRQPVWVPPGRWRSVTVDVTAVRVAVIPLAASPSAIALYGDDLLTGVTPQGC